MKPTLENLLANLTDKKISLEFIKRSENESVYDIHFNRCSKVKGPKFKRHINKLKARLMDAIVIFELREQFSSHRMNFLTQLENDFELLSDHKSEGISENSYCCYVEMQSRYGFGKIKQAYDEGAICAVSFCDFKIKRSSDGSLKIFVSNNFNTEGVSSRQFLDEKEILVAEICSMFAALHCVEMYIDDTSEEYSNSHFNVYEMVKAMKEQKATA